MPIQVFDIEKKLVSPKQESRSSLPTVMFTHKKIGWNDKVTNSCNKALQQIFQFLVQSYRSYYHLRQKLNAHGDVLMKQKGR
jgi:hypothetical protein